MAFPLPDFSGITAGDLPVLLTLILLEGILSFDNAAVLAAMTNRLPREQRRKALLYGIVGAYVFRLLAIGFVFILLENIWLQLLGAAYLLYLPLNHFIKGEHGQHHTEREPYKIPGLSAFWSTVVFVELTDIAFALDQIVAAVALSDNVTVIVLAAFVGIIFLRVAAYYIGRIMEWFPALESLAYLAVGVVGLKMSLHVAGEFYGFHIPYEKEVSVAITLSLIAVPPIVKLVYEKVKGEHPVETIRRGGLVEEELEEHELEGPDAETGTSVPDEDAGKASSKGRPDER